MNKQLKLKIVGLVQGIGYRYSSEKEAKKRGLVGYVTNLEDGSVELVTEGEEEALKDFIHWCYNGVGPATVQTIEETWNEATGLPSRFRSVSCPIATAFLKPGTRTAT